jgi:propionate CoA-transferase
VAVRDGRLHIVQEGMYPKFVAQVQQVTFNGAYARSLRRPVLYVTERAVFTLTEEGLTLTEIAPGIDLERHVLALMEFRPWIAPDLKEMDSCIFRPAPMGLARQLL